MLPDRVLPWDVAGFEALAEPDFEVFLALEPGSPAARHRRAPALPASAPDAGARAQARIGVEVMDLQAACRTYNILMAEERHVAAALLFA